MMYLKWALRAPLLLAFYVFCYMTCWLWAAIAATFKLDKLPGPLCWVHTHDDTIYGSNYLTSHSLPIPSTWGERWRGAMWWICRNPGYGFAAYVLGFEAAMGGLGDLVVKHYDTPEGAFYTMRPMTGGEWFSWRWQKHGIKVWLGWQYHPQAGWHIMKFNVTPHTNG